MIDARLRPLIDPPLDHAARVLSTHGVTAAVLTLVGCALGLLAGLAVVVGWFWLALALFVVGRICDGLDGAVARITGPTDRGAFLDVTCDFLVYAALPLAFAVHVPLQNALPAACLLATFLANGSAFLAFALMADRRKLTTEAQGRKSIFYLAGLAEGAETIVFFCLMLIWPQWFAPLAYVFAGLTLASALGRVVLAWGALK